MSDPRLSTDLSGLRRGIYTASKTKHAHLWLALRAAGEPIISTWIDEAGAGESACLHDLWDRCISESRSCRVLIVYKEPEDVLKGAWVEIGAALAVGTPVYAVGMDGFTISNYRGITHFPDITAAFAAARGITALAQQPATCDCGFSADTCKTNHCYRKQIATSGLVPEAKYPNCGAAQGKPDRPEVAHAESGDPSWPEHFSCDFDTSAPNYTITWRSADRNSSKWLSAMPNGKIVAGEVDLVANTSRPVSLSIDEILTQPLDPAAPEPDERYSPALRSRDDFLASKGLFSEYVEFTQKWDAKGIGAVAYAVPETYTEICINEKCPRGGRPVEIVRAPSLSSTSLGGAAK